MRIPKSLVVLSVAVFGVVGSLHAQRDDSDLQLKAREELRQKMAELDSAQSPAAPDSTPVAPAKKVKPVKVRAPQVVTPPVEMAPMAPVAPVAPVAPRVATPYSVDADARAKAEELVRQKMAELDAQEKSNVPEASAPAVKVGGSTAFKPVPVVASPETAVTPVVMPPPAIGSKQQRLNVLLQRYKADQITPQEYHTQRAEILAEP